MNIILIDTEKYTPDRIQDIVNSIKKFSKEEKWIFLPKDINVLLDCSIEQLYYIRNRIDEAISNKENIIKTNLKNK